MDLSLDLLGRSMLVEELVLDWLDGLQASMSAIGFWTAETARDTGYGGVETTEERGETVSAGSDTNAESYSSRLLFLTASSRLWRLLFRVSHPQHVVARRDLSMAR